MPVYSKNFYFETSGINYYSHNFTNNDIIATKAFQSAKGNIYYISPICLWEILLTKDEVLKEKLIYCSQNLFYNKLIKSPSEFIVNFVKSGIKVIESPYNIHTDLEIGQVWEQICYNKNKSLYIDEKILQDRTKILRKLSKNLYDVINRITLDITVQDETFYNQEIIRFYFMQIAEEYGPFDEIQTKIVKISILLVNYIFCGQIDLDPTPYINFWNSLGIKSPLERALFLFKNYKDIFLVGPFYMMATMAYVQISNGQKSNRGLILDCLHSIYLTYTDVFVTNDNHFNKLSEVIPIHGNKIIYLEEANITSHQVNINNKDGV